MASSELTGTPYPTGTLSQSQVQQRWLSLLWLFSLFKRLTRLAHRLMAGLKTEKGKATQPLTASDWMSHSITLFYSALTTSHKLNQIGGKSSPLHREQCYITRWYVFKEGRKSHLQSINILIPTCSFPHQHLPNPSPCHIQAWSQELCDLNLVCS